MKIRVYQSEDLIEELDGSYLRGGYIEEIDDEEVEND